MMANAIIIQSNHKVQWSCFSCWEWDCVEDADDLKVARKVLKVKYNSIPMVIYCCDIITIDHDHMAV